MNIFERAILVIVSLILLCGVFIIIVSASNIVPNDVISWQRADGAECVTDIRNDGPHTFCDCGCDTDCGSTPNQTSIPTDIPTETPEPTEKTKCNAGKGNGSEGDPDCDPGNSGGNNNAGD